MPETRVLEIYKDDYWLTRPHRYPWPLNLAVMNTEENSGGGRAQIFIDRMERDVPNDSVSEKASWFVDQQTAFYYAIANNNSKLRVFLRGWLNRSNYMQDVIAGVISLNGHDLEDEEGSAKAYEGGSEEQLTWCGIYFEIYILVFYLGDQTLQQFSGCVLKYFCQLRKFDPLDRRLEYISKRKSHRRNGLIASVVQWLVNEIFYQPGKFDRRINRETNW